MTVFQKGTATQYKNFLVVIIKEEFSIWDIGTLNDD